MAEKRLVASTPQGALRLLGSGGTFAVRNFQQIRQYLKASLGEETARLLAEPAFDNANARIDWYATSEAAPTPLSTLDPAAQEALRAKLQERRQRIQGLAEALSKREQQSALLLGELLRQALSVPNEEALLAADGEPLLINWGSAADQPRDSSSGTVLAGTMRGAPQKPAPVPAPVAATPVAAVATVPPRRGAGYWLWALPLWLLFAIIMSVIYYELLEACGASGPGPEDNDNPFITFCPGEAVADTGPPPALVQERERAATLKERLRQLEIQAVEARRECSRPQPGGKPATPTPGPGPTPSPTPTPAPAPQQ